MILDEQTRPNWKERRWTALGTALLICLLAGTYIFQFQPAYEPPENEQSGEVTSDEVYIIDRGDGKYLLIDRLQRAEPIITDDMEIIETLRKQGCEVRQEK